MPGYRLIVIRLFRAEAAPCRNDEMEREDARNALSPRDQQRTERVALVSRVDVDKGRVHRS